MRVSNLFVRLRSSWQRVAGRKAARSFLLAAVVAVACAALGQFMTNRAGAQTRGAKKSPPSVEVLKSPSTGGVQSASPAPARQTNEPAGTVKRKAPIVIDPAPPQSVGGGAVYTPTSQPLTSFPPVNVRSAAQEEALNPAAIDVPSELRPIHAPKGEPPPHGGLPIPENVLDSQPPSEIAPQAPVPSASGPSPGPTKTFKAEFLSGTNIPPDTMGAVGTTHVVSVSNNQMSIRTRDGVQVQRMTLTAFWAGVTIKGAAVSAFDPKVLYDRFNQRWILVSSFNGQSVNSGAGLAVSQTNDPTGTWNRYTITTDPSSTASGGLWIDYPSLGHNKNWIILNENVFGFGTVSGYQRSDVYVFDKQAAYAGTLVSASAFQASTSTCVSPFETQLGCGFTMAPTIVEDNTTDAAYLVEDWDATAGQLRVSKLTGTASTPVLTVGTQFPQSPFSWKFNANRVDGAAGSGGYAPQRQLFTYAPSGTRIMTNDSRIQNAVLRNGSIWTTHTVMVAATPTAAGVGYSTTNPDVRSAVQWWQIDPTIETGTTSTPLQRARIEDPTADNCNSSNTQSGNSLARAGCTTANQVGQFYAYPNISVNQNNDVLIGFTQFSAFTYPSGAYAIRRSADPANTTRDPVVFRPGQTNYDLQANTNGTTSGLQTRWGDYSASMVDPLDDTKFWTVQEYAGTKRSDFAGSLRTPWETWWAQVDPAAAQPSKTGNLIITEFRLRGPQGAQDEFIELYNPNADPVIVNTSDNSDGWAVGFDSGTTQPPLAVLPNGTVVPPLGHFLVANNPDNTDGPAVTYSLNAYPALPGVRGSDSDTGYHIDIADNQGVAIFRTSTRANFSLATRMDAAGFSTLAPASLFKEGNGIPAITTQPTTNFSYYRTRCPSNTAVYGSALGCSSVGAGTPKDSDANENDFVFVDTNGSIPTAGIQRLGGPGPENLQSPIIRNGAFTASMVDATVSGNSPPNRVRTFSGTSPATFGTLSIRRRMTNNTGVPVTRLRFRVNDITTLPAPSGYADLRVITSTDVVVSGVNDAATCAAAGQSAPCSITIRGTTLEEPPTQVNGGGFNSTLSAGVITLDTPLAPGASVNLQFLLGIEQTGNFRFFINIEALP